MAKIAATFIHWHPHGAVGLPSGGMHMRSCGLLYLKAACGLAHIYPQPYFRSHTSATSLPFSGLAVQAPPIRTTRALAQHIALVPDLA